MEHHVIKI